MPTKGPGTLAERLAAASEKAADDATREEKRTDLARPDRENVAVVETPAGVLSGKPAPVPRPSPAEFHHTASRQRLSFEKLVHMGKAQIQAVATDRGYGNLGIAGRKVLATRFLEKQAGDTGELHDPPGGAAAVEGTAGGTSGQEPSA